MFNKFLKLPLAKKSAFITASLCFFACVILTLASYHTNRQLIAQSTEMLGENLAQQLARDASSSLVQGDKLSLQSLLNNLMESPAIVHSAIYDVENQPIAEAGEAHRGIADKAFSASITFQDSLAGYAVINIDPKILNEGAVSLMWQLFALGLLIACLAYLVGLAPARYLASAIDDLTVVASKPLENRPANIHIAYRGQDELQLLAQQIISGPDITEEKKPKAAAIHSDEHAVLYLEINNLKVLKEQRNQQSVKDLLDQCHRQLTTICKLYEGELKISGSQGFSVRFSSNNEQDFPFRALCSGYLISQQFNPDSDAINKNPMRVRIGVEIYQEKTTNSIDDPLGYQLALQQTTETARQLTEKPATVKYHAELIASKTLLQHPSVINKTVTTVIDDSCASVDDLQTPYNALLIKQLTALRSQYQ